MNADKTVYARYGSRTSFESADRDVTLDGLLETMKDVLECHRTYPANRKQLAAKQPIATSIKRPQQLSLLRKYKTELDYQGKVTQSCIHCHQIIDAQRIALREQRKTVPNHILYPFPSPKILGLKLDPKFKATIEKVESGSWTDGKLLPGDQILQLNQHQIMSPADVDWALHVHASDRPLNFVVERNGFKKEVTITLPQAWRKNTDISWRPSSWDLRRMATGGMIFKPLSPNRRKGLGIQEHQMALLVTHVGKYGAHARARRAGFRVGDVVTQVDEQSDLMRESDFFEYALNDKNPGDKIRLVVDRNGRTLQLSYRLQ